MRTIACLGLALCLLPLACGGDDSSSADGGPDAIASADGGGGDGGGGPDGSSQTDGGGGDGGTTGSQDFPGSSTIYQDVSKAAADSEWGTIQTSLEQTGWGPFQLDPSMAILHADANLTRRAFTDVGYGPPDCDSSPIALPPGGNIEGSSDYHCANQGDDCHLLVYQGTRLYELYQADVTGGQATGGTFTGTCLAVWDLTHDYWQPGNPFSRGDGCTGSDAADMPIAPLLVTKAEIQAGKIAHAMRFTLKNSLIRKAVYVHPATHLGGPTGGSNTMPYGARIRLRSDYNLASLPSDAARTIAKALQTYGMFLDDGSGSNYLFVSATTDLADVMDTHDLKALTPADFEMVDGGTRYNFSQQNCSRTVVSN